MIRITRAVQTSLACPSQWDAWDSEDNYYYLRFRHGQGLMVHYKTEDWADAPDVKPYEEWVRGTDNIYNMNSEFLGFTARFEYGDEYLGDISLEKFAELAGFELDLQAYTDFGNHIRDELVKEGLTFLLDFEHGGEEDGPGGTPAG